MTYQGITPHSAYGDGYKDGYQDSRTDGASFAPRLEAADKLAEAAREVDAHLQELEEAWRKGIIDELDRTGGTRSNRNVDCERLLQSALAAYDAAKKEKANG